MWISSCPQLRDEDSVRLLVVDADLVEEAVGSLEVGTATGQDLDELVAFAGSRTQGAYIDEGQGQPWTRGLTPLYCAGSRVTGAGSIHG